MSKAGDEFRRVYGDGIPDEKLRNKDRSYRTVVPSGKNREVLMDFAKYCAEHPNERFWQALRNWSGYPTILVETILHANCRDTFYFEGRRHDSK